MAKYWVLSPTTYQESHSTCTCTRPHSPWSSTGCCLQQQIKNPTVLVPDLIHLGQVLDVVSKKGSRI